MLTESPILSLDDGGGSPRRRRQPGASLVAEGLRGLVAERAVRAVAVVVDAPELCLDASARDGGPVRLREALVAEVAVEALDVSILRGLAGLDEVQRDACRRPGGCEEIWPTRSE